MSRRRGEFRYMQVDILYMHAACRVCVSENITTLWITQQASSFILQRPPLPPLSFSKRFFLSFFSKAIVVSVCQVILLPVQIMTIIKQLRPARRGGHELAFLTHPNRRQMRIHRGIQHYGCGMLAPFGADNYSGCQRGKGNKCWWNDVERIHIYAHVSPSLCVSGMWYIGVSLYVRYNEAWEVKEYKERHGVVFISK